ncbi:PPK2 family polyphosphate:nucleotide phosphotransferase [Trueperella bonasi]|uniref:PPK2 family polyphosphate:nucleotide phosphotransferase n=1 Tax=Trueperella bonasi TaxID=312286 RepID=A0ABT9NGG6_9ACTO|nr:PPK2 family polyphosphate kinase [Trueperella bonasi]MDP9806098.1 PPK2 family polyphosphate:nucleotide phosphotransferase [Trueperella bonasi]
MSKDAEQYAGKWTTSPTIALRATDDFELATLNRNSTPGWDGKKKHGKALTKQRGKILDELQERFFANARLGDERRILLVLQGLDTAGKGGIVRHVFGMVDPQGVHIANFGVPTEEELSHHFLWRIKKALPPAGKIGVFDRSHYEDVLIGRVDKLAPADEIDKRYDHINRWEESLVEDGYTIIKVALMHSHREQGMRLANRLARPDKWWKYSTNDIDTRGKWDAYQEAYQIMFDRTSTEHAPWHVVPADRKWYARLAVTELVVQALVDLEQEWPIPRWDLEVQRRRLLETMNAEDVEKAQKKLQLKRSEVNEEILEVDRVRRAIDAVGELDDGERVGGDVVVPKATMEEEIANPNGK